MKILQLIDTLEAGGAEKMAVSLANGLHECGHVSALAVTRRSGPLQAELSRNVHFLNMSRKRTVDLAAFLRLSRFVALHRIEIVQAHGPSFFTATLLKFRHPLLKIIWHEHYGARASQNKKNNKGLYICSFFFFAAITVTEELVDWVLANLHVRNVHFVPNFSDRSSEVRSTILAGEEDKRIVMVANLKYPKNHIAVLKAFLNSGLGAIGWTLHFIGRDYEDGYSAGLKSFTAENAMSETVLYHGTRHDIMHILEQADIGVLASEHEGFPVTLLEYAKAGLAVVCSDTGYSRAILDEGRCGLLFSPEDIDTLSLYLRKLAADEIERKSMGIRFKEFAARTYSRQQTLEKIEAICRTP